MYSCFVLSIGKVIENDVILTNKSMEIFGKYFNFFGCNYESINSSKANKMYKALNSSESTQPSEYLNGTFRGRRHFNEIKLSLIA